MDILYCIIVEHGHISRVERTYKKKNFKTKSLHTHIAQSPYFLDMSSLAGGPTGEAATIPSNTDLYTSCLLPAILLMLPSNTDSP